MKETTIIKILDHYVKKKNYKICWVSFFQIKTYSKKKKVFFFDACSDTLF